MAQSSTYSEKLPLTTKTAPALHHLFLYQDPPFPIPQTLIGSSQLEPNVSRIYTPQLKSWVSLLRSTLMKIELIESSETSALKAQTPGDYPENTIRHFLNCRYSISCFLLLFILTDYEVKYFVILHVIF